MRRLRQGSELLETYNDGPWVFLYDAANAEELKSSRAVSVLVGAKADRVVDEAIRRRDLLIVYELQQDDPIEAELCVGEPLTNEEKKDLPYLAPRESRLHLPTGRLRVESLNTSTIDEDEPTEPGIEIQVEAGLYLVRIESLEIGHEDLTESVQPSEFISLNRIESDVGIGLDPMMALDVKKPATRIEQVRNNVFHGTVKSDPVHSTQICVDLRAEDADELGLSIGQRLLVSTPQESCVALYSRFQIQRALERLLGVRGLAQLYEQGVGMIASLQMVSGSPPHILNLDHLAPQRMPFTPESGVEVSIRSQGADDLPQLRDDLIDSARMKKGHLHAHVLYARSGAFLLNATSQKLRKIGLSSLMSSEPPIVAKFEDQQRVIYIDRKDRPDMLDEARTNFFAQQGGTGKLRAELERLEASHKLAEQQLLGAMRGPDSEGRIADLCARVDDCANELNAQEIPAELRDRAPLSARIFPSWRQPDENLLLVEPILGINTGLDVAPGSIIELFRRE
jgi:hypothetical protein